MDTNLYFRFSMPGWTGMLTAIWMLWASGKLDIHTFCRADNKNNLTVVAGAVMAILSAPAIGFVLNTEVVGICDIFRTGPVHSESFRKLWDKCSGKVDCVQILFSKRSDPNLASLMAHFEYRLDPEPMIDWRRRQRAAFFANYSNALAVLLGLIIAKSYWWHFPMKTAVGIAMMTTLVLVLFFCHNAHRGCDLADKQQSLWVESLTIEQAEEYMLKNGVGLKQPRYIQKRQSDKSNDGEHPATAPIK